MISNVDEAVVYLRSTGDTEGDRILLRNLAHFSTECKVGDIIKLLKARSQELDKQIVSEITKVLMEYKYDIQTNTIREDH